MANQHLMLVAVCAQECLKVKKGCCYQLVLTLKKHALQQRGRPGGRGLLLPLLPSLSSSRAWSRASSRSTILTAETNGVGFCRARARALLTTAHSSLPETTSDHQRTHKVTALVPGEHTGAQSSWRNTRSLGLTRKMLMLACLLFLYNHGVFCWFCLFYQSIYK